jgi:hypothetical protein
MKRRHALNPKLELLQGKGANYTDMQFHTSTDAGGSDFESDGEDGPQYEWLHGDGGLEMQKRVLVGLFQQKALHTLARKVWPAQVSRLSRDINSWLSDPQFSQVSPRTLNPNPQTLRLWLSDPQFSQLSSRTHFPPCPPLAMFSLLPGESCSKHHRELMAG